MINKATGEIFTFIRTPYNYDTDQTSQETGLDCSVDKNGRTQQQFKEETDINTIVDKFLAAGEMPPTTPFPEEQDFTEAFDFQTSMNVVVQARESFMQMPAKQRARFQNDPQQFMEFMHNHENQEEAIRLGLAIRREKPEAPTEKPVNTPKEPVKEKKE